MRKLLPFMLLFISSISQAQFGPSVDEKWHLADVDKYVGISLDKAYKLVAKKESTKIVVAIIDSGFDTDHPDLKNKLWTNRGEIAGNGIDDDANGYVDDIHGWNFLANAKGEMMESTPSEADRLFRLLAPKYFLQPLDSIKKEDIEECRFFYDVVVENSSFRKTVAFMEEYNVVKDKIPALDSIFRNHYPNGKLDYEEFLTLEQIVDKSNHQEVFNYVLKLYSGYQRDNWDRFLLTIKSLKERYMSAINIRINEKYLNPRAIIGDRYDDINDRYYGTGNLKAAFSSHGTHVAGIIGAERDNNRGIDGIVDNVELMLIRAVPNGDETDKDVALAIYYAVNNGAKIINMSFGKSISLDKKWVDDAIKYAQDKGVLIVHAAGNSGRDLDFFTIYPNPYFLDGTVASNMITVGASNFYGSPMPFSNYSATKVDLFAPGYIYSTIENDKYMFNGGTSMACPVVTGVAALIWSYYPEFSVNDIRLLILSSTFKVPVTARVGLPVPKEINHVQITTSYLNLCVTGGIVNAHNALLEAAEFYKLKYKK